MYMICFTSDCKDIDMLFFANPCYDNLQSFYDRLC